MNVRNLSLTFVTAVLTVAYAAPSVAAVKQHTDAASTFADLVAYSATLQLGGAPSKLIVAVTGAGTHDFRAGIKDNNVLLDRVDRSGCGVNNLCTTLTFAQDVSAFFGHWNFSPLGEESGNGSINNLRFSFWNDGQQVGDEVLYDAPDRAKYANQDFGYSSDTKFDSVRIRMERSDSRNDYFETYSLGNLQFGVVSSVPEPSTALMLGLGMLGVVAARRRARH